MIGTVIRMLLVTSLKDKISLFYSLMFPLLLMAGLGYYFDSPEYRERLLVGVIALGIRLRRPPVPRRPSVRGKNRREGSGGRRRIPAPFQADGRLVPHSG